MKSLYDKLVLYSTIPGLNERDKDGRSERLWKSTLHITRRSVDEVVWYEELDEYKEIVLECLDRVTILTYSLLDLN